MKLHVLVRAIFNSYSGGSEFDPTLVAGYTNTASDFPGKQKVFSNGRDDINEKSALKLHVCVTVMRCSEAVKTVCSKQHKVNVCFLFITLNFYYNLCFTISLFSVGRFYM
jgi:hypothetical protein